MSGPDERKVVEATDAFFAWSDEPKRREHINLTGDYVWHTNKRIAKGRFRPMRKPQDSISRLFMANFEA
jgi:hypothetical protein